MNEMRTVKFHGSSIAVIERDGKQYVAMKPIVEAMGLKWHKQYEMIMRDPVLSAEAIPITGIPSGGGLQEMICLPLDYLNGWLFKIPASRYFGKRRESIIAYQRECYRALFDYFHQGGAINPRANDSQIEALVATLREEVYRRVSAEEKIKHLEARTQALSAAATPTCEYGEPSELNGLPRDILVSRYLRSDPRPHRPSLTELLQHLLPLYAEQ